MTFYSKIDTWFLIVMIGVVLVSCYGFFSLISKGNIQQNWIPLSIFIVLGIGLPVSITFGTYYKIEENNLFVRTSIFTWNIPIDSIRSIKETKFMGSSPALSIDRLSIDYEGGSLIVSPKEKAQFIEALNINSNN